MFATLCNSYRKEKNRGRKPFKIIAECILPVNDFMGASLVTLKIFELWVNNLCLGIADLYRFLPTPTIQLFHVKQESLYWLGFLIFDCGWKSEILQIALSIKDTQLSTQRGKYLLEVL